MVSKDDISFLVLQNMVIVGYSRDLVSISRVKGTDSYNK